MKCIHDKLHFESHDLICFLKHKVTGKLHLCVLYKTTLQKGQVRLEASNASFSAGLADTAQAQQALETFKSNNVLDESHIVRKVYLWDGADFVAYAKDWRASKSEPDLAFLGGNIQQTDITI